VNGKNEADQHSSKAAGIEPRPRATQEKCRVRLFSCGGGWCWHEGKLGSERTMVNFP